MNADQTKMLKSLQIPCAAGVRERTQRVEHLLLKGRPRFGSQPPHGSSPPSTIPVPGDPMWPALLTAEVQIHYYRQNV